MPYYYSELFGHIFLCWGNSGFCPAVEAKPPSPEHNRYLCSVSGKSLALLHRRRMCDQDKRGNGRLSRGSRGPRDQASDRDVLA